MDSITILFIINVAVGINMIIQNWQTTRLWKRYIFIKEDLERLHIESARDKLHSVLIRHKRDINNQNKINIDKFNNIMVRLTDLENRRK